MKIYERLCRAMQDGVEYQRHYDGRELLPDQLRVDINTAICEHDGLVALLIERGLITFEDYEAATTAKMRDRVADYEAWCRSASSTRFR